MSDEVLAVKYSPDGKLLAVSLLDSTVRVFYEDTLKFFLSLYGHKVTFYPFVQFQNTNQPIVASSRYGYFRRFKINHNVLCGQKRKNLGSRLWRLSQIHLRAY